MGLNGRSPMVLKAPKNTSEELNSNVFLPEIMTRLLKIIHRSCFEQFHVGTTFFLLNYTCQIKSQHRGQRAHHRREVTARPRRTPLKFMSRDVKSLSSMSDAVSRWEKENCFYINLLTNKVCGLSGLIRSGCQPVV